MRLALAAFVIALGSCASTRDAPFGEQIAVEDLEPVRGLWITRWDYASPADIELAMRDAASLGTTDIYFQVRGQADAYYRSNLEPWGVALGSQSAAGPGFDPLAVATREAHRQGMRIHAWVNVMPLWRGSEPPRDPRHPMNRHPEWRLTDRSGTPQPLHNGYVIANPALPEVRAHLARVMGDIAARYDIDGLHLDYIRFVGDELETEPVRPGDDRTLQLFRLATGRSGLDSPADRDAYRAWMRDQITQVVSEIARSVRAVRPGVELSAAVWRRPEIAHDEKLQDHAAWIERGLLDRLIPMIYTADHAQFRDDLAAWQGAAPRGRLAPGIGVYKHDPADTPRQIAIIDGSGGYVLFAYSSVFDSASRFQGDDAEASGLRAARRRVLMDLADRIASAGG